MADMGKIVKELKSKAKTMMAHGDTLSLVGLVQATFLSRGASGIKGASRRFRIMDDNENKSLNYDEFSKGLRDVGLNLTEAQMRELFAHFDRDDGGEISFDEFLREVQPKMNERRKKLVLAAFASMDTSGDGQITVAEMAKKYKCKFHPKYLSGEMTEKQVIMEFMETFEAGDHVDGCITLEEFMSYYASISCSIDNDAYFDLMMRNSWPDLDTSRK